MTTMLLICALMTAGLMKENQPAQRPVQVSFPSGRISVVTARRDDDWLEVDRIWVIPREDSEPLRAIRPGRCRYRRGSRCAPNRTTGARKIWACTGSFRRMAAGTADPYIKYTAPSAGWAGGVFSVLRTVEFFVKSPERRAGDYILAVNCGILYLTVNF